MQGNIFFAIKLIIFMFLLIIYTFFLMKKTFKGTSRVERLCSSMVTSLVAVLLPHYISINYLESLYFSDEIVFWFVFFALASTIQRIFCTTVNLVNKKICECTNS